MDFRDIGAHPGQKQERRACGGQGLGRRQAVTVATEPQVEHGQVEAPGPDGGERLGHIAGADDLPGTGLLQHLLDVERDQEFVVEHQATPACKRLCHRILLVPNGTGLLL